MEELPRAGNYDVSINTALETTIYRALQGVEKKHFISIVTTRRINFFLIIFCLLKDQPDAYNSRSGS